MKKAVVTGGAGFIGSNLAEELANMGYEVVILDNLSTGNINNLSNLLKKGHVKFVKGSVTDFEMLKSIFKDADYVFHHAAIPSVSASIEEPAQTNEVNVLGTLNVLLAAKECGVEKVIYASSSAVYGDSPNIPKKESMNPHPKSPYAVSKLAAEYYCNVFYEVYELKTVSLRYFNVYGPRQDPFSEYSAVIPRFIMRVLRGKPPIIYGDGTQTRDFVFVKDVVNANILAAESNATGIFNIGSGRSISVNELAYKIMDMIGNDTVAEPIYEKPRKGDIKHSSADITKAKRELGYRPEYDIEAGLNETIKYFSSLLRPTKVRE